MGLCEAGLCENKEAVGEIKGDKGVGGAKGDKGKQEGVPKYTPDGIATCKSDKGEVAES